MRELTRALEAAEAAARRADDARRGERQQQARAARERAAAEREALAAQLRALRAAYFRPVGPPPGAAVAAGDVGRHARGAVEEAEAVVGLGVCELSHEQVMAAMERYVERQRQVTSEALQAAASSPSSQHAASGSGEGEAAAEEAVGKELLWLEGCMLLVLVQLRQREHELRSGAPRDAAATNIDSASSPRSHAGSGGSAPSAAGLVQQMLKAMAQDKRRLQQQVSTLSAAAAAAAAAHHQQQVSSRASRCCRARAALLHNRAGWASA